jgi:hypothetical protein
MGIMASKMLPNFIINWIRTVFADVNRRVSEKILNVPGAPEPSLDLTFIEHLTNYSAPQKFASDWAVRLDTHYLGGLAHFGQWEIADIGVFVFFQRKGKMLRRKVALLQSKRLYPTNRDVEHVERYDYVVGMARIANRPDNVAPLLLEGVFEFSDASEYGH